jgi:hypothetical protein
VTQHRTTTRKTITERGSDLVERAIDIVKRDQTSTWESLLKEAPTPSPPPTPVRTYEQNEHVSR